MQLCEHFHGQNVNMQTTVIARLVVGGRRVEEEKGWLIPAAHPLVAPGLVADKCYSSGDVCVQLSSLHCCLNTA